MADSLTVTLHMETSEFEAICAEGEALLERSPVWLRWLATLAFERLQEPVELLSIDGESSPATRAGDVRVLAKPTQQFVRFVAALRAGNGQPSGLVDGEFEVHGRLSRG